jgi:LAO/AO transport system kinase
MDLAQLILEGDRLALARTLTLIENNQPEGQTALNALFPYSGQAHLVGVTGAPGTGKSSLVNQLARFYRQPPDGAAPRRVAVIAVDPTSPFTGGAILGDRIRMRDLSGDPGVFIRSMASRGTLGGLAAATASVAQVFDAAGFDVILVETVGAGQDEIEIARLAHTTVVIETPGMGDDIQAIKAGILEIADILVINKADQSGVENTERALRGMLELAHPTRRPYPGQTIQDDLTDTPLWIPPIKRTVATENIGTDELATAIEQHRQYLQGSGEWQQRERERLSSELRLVLRETLLQDWLDQVPSGIYQSVLDSLYQRQVSPRQAVQFLLASSKEANR